MFDRLLVFLKPLIFPPCRLIAGVGLIIKRYLPRRKKRILLAGNSEVTIDILLRIDAMLHDLTDRQSSLVVPRQSRNFARKKLMQSPKKPPLIGIIHALCMPWDLIVFSAHYNPGWFHKQIPKIYCSHGIGCIKMDETGCNTNYGHKTLDKRGRLIYDVMFVESFYMRSLALRCNSALQGKLSVVGNLMADELLAMNQNRVSIRQRLGLHPGKRMLLLISTWKPESLIQKFGLPVLQSLSELSGTYTIFLLIHPLNDHVRFPHKREIQRLMQTYKRDGIAKRIDQNDSFLPYLVAADVVMTDHSSVFLYAALLKKPYLCIPLDLPYLIRDELTWKLYELRDAYNPDHDLHVQLEQAINEFPVQQVKPLASQIVDKRGQAEQCIRAEIKKFL